MGTMDDNHRWDEAQKTLAEIRQNKALEIREMSIKFVKKHNRTFWKAVTDFHTDYIHIHVNEGKTTFYAHAFVFEVHTSGEKKIRQKQLHKTELEEYLQGVAEESLEERRNREMDFCDCEGEEIDTHEYPKSTMTNISEEEFKREVQKQILDTYSIGLTFK